MRSRRFHCRQSLAMRQHTGHRAGENVAAVAEASAAAIGITDIMVAGMGADNRTATRGASPQTTESVNLSQKTKIRKK